MGSVKNFYFFIDKIEIGVYNKYYVCLSRTVYNIYYIIISDTYITYVKHMWGECPFKPNSNILA